MSVMDTQGQQIPPELLAMLAQQGGGPQGPPPGPQDQGGSHSDQIRELLDLAREVAANADDDIEAATLEKVTTMLAQILADQQKQDQGLVQGKMDPRALTRALKNG